MTLLNQPFVRSRAVALCALAVLFDGLDNQLIGFAAPALIADLRITKAALVPMVAGSLIAMTIGTVAAGFLADRFGRRWVLIAAVLLFGAGNALIALAPDLRSILILRLVGALGLGGAMPAATALIAELVPPDRRGFGVTLGIVCIPLGGLIGGILASMILPKLGWRALFAIGGLMPIAAAVVFIAALPETGAALSLRSASGRRDRPQGEAAENRISALFAPSLARDTMLYWLAFFSCLFAVYSVFNWAPTYLTQRGFGVQAASQGLAAFNLGGVVGALFCGRLIDRFGSQRPLAAMGVLAVAAAAAMSLSPASPAVNFAVTLAQFAALGLFVNGVQTSLFAVGAIFYPAAIRGTGIGMALGFGRLGAVASSFAGVAALSGDGNYYMPIIGAAMTVFLFMILLFDHHSAPFRSSGLSDC